MSTTQGEFEAKIRVRLQGRTPHEQFHLLERVLERLRLIHNAVGACTEMRPEMTVQEFSQLYPNVYDRLKDVLAPYVVSGYLNEAGWDYFTEYCYDSRDEGARNVYHEVRQWMRDNEPVDPLDPLE